MKDLNFRVLLLLLEILSLFQCQDRIVFPDEINAATAENFLTVHEAEVIVTSTSESDLDYDILLDRLLNSTKSIGLHGIPSPNLTDFGCGYVNQIGSVYFGFIENKDGESEIYPIYFLNETAEELSSKGFDVKINEVISDDVLYNFTYSNETFENTLAFLNWVHVAGPGGRPAPVARSYYMAQLGERKGNNISWLCDGVLLNTRWILSAAHCFTFPGVEPNIVRLGDHNLTDPSDPHQTAGPKFIRDYPIHQLIPHPNFKIGERYHDLILIQIPREIPKRAPNFQPICLPWDLTIDKDLVGEEVALTGWGALQYGGPKTPILQEIILKVFDTSVCAKAYSNVADIQIKYPKGIKSDKILCSGWEEGGRDACGGDSGAPLTYKKSYTSDSGWTSYKYILVGIVSGGFGCGLKDFPGLYIPITNPDYLQWIKEIAFSEYL